MREFSSLSFQERSVLTLTLPIAKLYPSTHRVSALTSFVTAT